MANIERSEQEEGKVNEQLRRRAEAIALFMGGDYNMTVGLGPYGSGWHWDFVKNHVNMDPKDLLEESEDVAKGVAAHEGNHRMVSRPEHVTDLWPIPGFSFGFNAVEDPRANEGGMHQKPGSKEWIEAYVERDLSQGGVLDYKGINKDATDKLGYVPKFMQWGGEMIHYWYEKEFAGKINSKEDSDNFLQSIPDKDVREMVEKTMPAFEEYYKTIPDSKDENEVQREAKKAADNFRKNIWPDYQKLVEKSLEDHSIVKAIEDAIKQNNQQQGGQQIMIIPFNQLPKDVQDEIKQKIKEQQEQKTNSQNKNQRQEQQNGKEQNQSEQSQSKQGGQGEQNQEGQEGEGEESQEGQPGQGQSGQGQGAQMGQGGQSGEGQSAQGQQEGQQGQESGNGQSGEKQGDSQQGKAGGNDQNGQAFESQKGKEAEENKGKSKEGKQEGEEGNGKAQGQGSGSSDSGTENEQKGSDSKTGESGKGNEPTEIFDSKKKSEATSAKQQEKNQEEEKSGSSGSQKSGDQKADGQESGDKAQSNSGEIQSESPGLGAGGDGKAHPIKIPWDKLSQKTKDEAKKLYDKLAKEQKQKYEDEAKKDLEKAEDGANEKLRGQMNDPRTNETHKEQEEREENERQKWEDQQKARKLIQQMEKQREKAMSGLAENPYFEVLNSPEISAIIREQERERKKIFSPSEYPDPRFSYTGLRPSMRKAMQRDADPRRSDIFEIKGRPTEKSHRFLWLIDESSSMHGKIDEAFKAVIVNAELDSKIGLEDAFIGFTDSLPDCIKIYKDFDVKKLNKDHRDMLGEILTDTYTIGSGTPTHEATKESYGILKERMKKRPMQHNYFITLTDGQPNTSVEELAKYIKTLCKDKSVVVWGAGIGPGTKFVNNIYPRLNDRIKRDIARKLGKNIDQISNSFEDAVEFSKASVIIMGYMVEHPELFV